MPTKVKRGLGLLVIAVVLLIPLIPLLGADGHDGAAGWVFALALLAVGVLFWVCLVVGLVMLAWGLLRD